MDKYRRVKKQSIRDSGDSKEDEIRIQAKGRTSTYVSYASKLFKEKNLDTYATGAVALVLTKFIASLLVLLVV